MKATRTHRTYSSRPIRRYAYPGAAEPRYYLERALDGLTALATGIGAVTVFLFLATL